MKNSKFTLIASMLIFGSIGIFVKNLGLPSSQIALLRGIIASIFLVLVSLITKQKVSWKAIKPNLILLIFSGAAIGVNWILLFEAYKYTSISNATISYYFAPVFVMILSPFVLKERLTAVKALCIAGAMLGMFFIVGNGEGSAKNDLLGIGYGLSAAVLYAFVVLMNKFLKGLSGLETTIMQLSVASVVLLPYVLLTEEIQLTQLDSKSIALIIWIGIINTGLAYLLYFSSMQKLSGQTIAVLSYIDPISAILMSSILLSERMTIIQLFGGVLILGATLLSELYGKANDMKVKSLS